MILKLLGKLSIINLYLQHDVAMYPCAIIAHRDTRIQCALMLADLPARIQCVPGLVCLCLRALRVSTHRDWCKHVVIVT